MYEVNSVAEYIDLIKQLSEESYNPLYYRGQSQDFPKMNSTAFRMSLLGKGSLHQGYPFKRMIEDFKYEVWNEIDNDTRKRFLAFCQHHGIPTNLLDFTENPLIALYFAVTGKEQSEPSYVYLINTPLLDITDLIEEYKIDKESIFELTFSNDETILNKLIQKFKLYEEKYPKEFYKKFKQLDKDLAHFRNTGNREYLYDSTELVSIDDEVFGEIESINKENKYSIRVPVYDSLLSTEIDRKLMRDTPDNATKYLLYLRYLRRLMNAEGNWPEYISGLLPMMYKPILNFKRGINQKGIFIYQNYIEQDPLKALWW